MRENGKRRGCCIRENERGEVSSPADTKPERAVRRSAHERALKTTRLCRSPLRHERMDDWQQRRAVHVRRVMTEEEAAERVNASLSQSVRALSRRYAAGGFALLSLSPFQSLRCAATLLRLTQPVCVLTAQQHRCLSDPRSVWRGLGHFLNRGCTFLTRSTLARLPALHARCIIATTAAQQRHPSHTMHRRPTVAADVCADSQRLQLMAASGV